MTSERRADRSRRWIASSTHARHMRKQDRLAHELRVNAARVQVIVDRKRDLDTPQWIIDLAESEL
jgi:ribosomal protein S7